MYLAKEDLTRPCQDLLDLANKLVLSLQWALANTPLPPSVPSSLWFEVL